MQNNSHYMVTSSGRESCTCTGGSKNDQDADADAGADDVGLTADEREALARELAMRTRFTLGQLAEMREGDLVGL